jgi:hypothetical protein
MRKQTEIQLILKRPHLYLPGILESYGIQCDATSTNGFGHRPIFRRENHFQCGEGWLPVISAFAEGLDQHFGLLEMKHHQSTPAEELPIVFIAGASTHDQRLYLHVEANRVADDAYGSSIEAMKALAAAISARHCEICGSSTMADEHKPVRCQVCRTREL